MALVQEQNRLFGFPMDRLAQIIRECGFRCGCCGICCTRSVNGHVFLLDHEVRLIKAIDPAAVEPAPGPEFRDESGTYYVSGFALSTKGDPDGSCLFLENSHCRIYNRRPSACRIYPYMLRRTPDIEGNVDWRFMTDDGGHGKYHHPLSWEASLALARDVVMHEHSVLTQEISFLQVLDDYFSDHGPRLDTGGFAVPGRRFPGTRPVPVMVYHEGRLERHQVPEPALYPPRCR